MSMPIQRQSESYNVFDDGNMRFARDYESRELPDGLVNMLNVGVGITAGLNDPRRMDREAGFGGAYSEPGAREDMSGGHGYDPHAEEMDERQLAQEADPASGYGFPGGNDPVFHEDPQAIPGEDVGGFGFGQGMPGEDYDPHSSENVGGQVGDYNEQFDPHSASFRSARSGGPAQSKTAAAAPAADPMAGWVGHGYVPGHRVGLPWRAQTIPGTVTHLEGQQVGIRWDDGQHSTEEPSDLRPL